MQRTVKVFVLSRQRPSDPPQAGPELTVEGNSHDALRDAARQALVAKGYRVRAVSFTPGGLVAYVESGQ